MSRENNLPVNLERSRALGGGLGAEPKQCYLNSFNAANFLGAGAVYVEGWVIKENNPIVIEHGWVEYEGELLDPTPVFNGVDAVPARYFVGVRYPQEELHEIARQVRFLPFVGVMSLSVETHREAYIEATVALYGIEAARLLHPKWHLDKYA